MQNNKNAWEKIFKKDGKYFLEAHPDLPEIVTLLKAQKVKKILDFGSGTGRHIIYLSKLGFEVTGIDISTTGIKTTKEWLIKEGLKGTLLKQDILEPIPFSENYFDAVISTQVIHHATLPEITREINEISRIVRSRGVIFVTVPPYKKYKKNKDGWTMKEIAKRTYLPLDGPEEGLVHYFFTKKELVNSLHQFKITKAYIDKTNHLAIIGIKK